MLALALPAAAPAVSTHTLSVYAEGNGDNANNIIATFSEATCKVEKQKGRTVFKADLLSKDRAYRINLFIPHWEGFKEKLPEDENEYEIEQGIDFDKPQIEFGPVNGHGPELFNSWFVPPFESFAFGRVAFRNGGHLLGIGYGPALWNEGETKAVFFTGVVECVKKAPPKKGKPGKKGSGGKKGKGKPGKHRARSPLR
jgi:hypothetical protein